MTTSGIARWRSCALTRFDTWRRMRIDCPLSFSPAGSADQTLQNDHTVLLPLGRSRATRRSMMSSPTKPFLMSAAVTVAWIAAYLAPGSAQQAHRVSPDLYTQLHWRTIGPEGNRFSAIAGVPGDPLVYYAGSASGGIFKTDDGGVHWEPIFDDQPASSIGALAVAPSDPNVVWRRTGEEWIPSPTSIGEGIYK